MGLFGALRIIWVLLMWQFWAVYQIIRGILWLFGVVKSQMPPPPPDPFSVTPGSRFEHSLIVAGSGHGKTQLLQQFLAKDIDALVKGHGSLIVIDSQGDMISKILRMAAMEQLTDRLVLIDPNDIDNPPALNLFDFGLDRLEQYTPVEREKLINGAIYLYEYLFGSLLGAELTQKQGVIFRYLARLMMVVPGATIHTLMEFMENPDAVRPHLDKLDRMTRHFFESQFFSSKFNNTREQILTRLWGVLSNGVLERMFGNSQNKLDLFTAMNNGSIILINTAKDLLKQDGCELLGRFFIALITLATQERASIPEEQRRSTFIYIDEAKDYFDEDGSMEQLFIQARKYKVGLIISCQNLDQFSAKLRATVMANTTIKYVGGLSAKDAEAFSKEMRCTAEDIHSMRKQKGCTDFMCFIRNEMERPIRLTVLFGEIEQRPKLIPEKYTELLQSNRDKYSTKAIAQLPLKQPVAIVADTQGLL